ncbi:unnamed protein product [marine sediment metagenome]|uniref:Uncharacterized protein n=1 Tax=marine sediment metagenome TaxID=412755 RepID=X1PTU3_9ZZZZ
MTLEEAIILLNKLLAQDPVPQQAIPRTAIALGAEALNAVINARLNSYWTPIPRLPGETVQAQF